MCVQNMRTKVMPVAGLRMNGFNPRSRIKKNTKKYKALLASIRQYGLMEPLLVSPDGLVINGHRRLSCLQDLGVTEVLCNISTVNAQLAWCESWATQQGINGRQIVEATAQGASVEYLPDGIAGIVSELQTIAGADFYQEMAAQGVSTNVIVALRKACRYTLDESPEWQRRVLHWLVSQKMQNEVRKIIDSDPANERSTRERMRAAINHNTPMRATY